MRDRFAWPVVAAPAPLKLPTIERSVLENGMRLWTMTHSALPVVALSLLIETGSVDDPTNLPGLCSMAVDMLDEGAAGRDSIQLATALADMGASLDLHAGPDAVSAQVWTVRQHLDGAVLVLADVLSRPHLNDHDLTRVRELRLSRLQQLRRSAASAADRAFSAAVFGDHGYGHSSLGTTDSVSRVTIDDVRTHHVQQLQRGRVTVLASGDVTHTALAGLVQRAFAQWPVLSPGVVTEKSSNIPDAQARVLFVVRDGAPQSEVRIGHRSVARNTPDYHAMTLLNAGLGGSFSGRLNQRLRQQLGYTYGARSSFDLDRRAGSFSCDSSVQGDKTAESVREMHALIDGVRGERPLSDDELAQARGSLTSGYARGFETPRQLVGALAQLAVYDLPDDVFSTFVPNMQAVSPGDVATVAERHLDPDHLTTVVVGDSQWRDSLDTLGIPVEVVAPEF